MRPSARSPVSRGADRNAEEFTGREENFTYRKIDGEWKEEPGSLKWNPRQWIGLRGRHIIRQSMHHVAFISGL
jgi:hypothetical protein